MKKKLVYILCAFLTLGFTAVTVSVYAQSPPQQGTDQPPHGSSDQSKGEPDGPPKEMVDACNKKTDGDSCSFTTPKNNQLQGTCRKMPSETELLCFPKLPQVVLDACKSKTEGDKCSFITPKNKTIEGSCRKGPPGETDLACLPAPPPDNGGSNENNNGNDNTNHSN